MKLRKELKPEDITLIVDTREQAPLNVAPMRYISKALETGDYSVVGFEHKIIIERKSIDDLANSLGNDRERFEKEIRRMRGIPHRAIMVEGSMDDIYKHKYRSKISPNSIIGSIMGYGSMAIPTYFCGSREQMADCLRRFAFISIQRIWNEHYEAINSMLQDVPPCDTKTA